MHQEYLTPSLAADYLGISKSKLARLRMVKNRHAGPTFIKIGGSVLYRLEDLEAWLNANRVQPSE